jgi:hypothetical protein
MSRFMALALCSSFAFGVAPTSAQTPSTVTDEETLKTAKIGTDAPALLKYLRERSRHEAIKETVRDLIRQLGDDSFAVRERASSRLVALGSPARPFLKEALASDDVEVARRAERILQVIDEAPSTSVTASVLRRLASLKPEGTAQTILDYLPKAEQDEVLEVALSTLTAVAGRDGHGDKVVLAALADVTPIRRAGAGIALCRASLELEAVRKLLRDTDASVRLQIAQELILAREKAAVPVLIAALAELPETSTRPAINLLCRIAEDQAPDAPDGDNTTLRQKRREIWTAWWTQHGPALDLGKLDAEHRLHGYTVVVLLDAGKIVGLGADKSTRWSIEGLQTPLDVQVLPNERVLVAEHAANRVTERSHKGEVLWEKKIDGPLVAQRLANGNTFVATRNEMYEFDKDGKPVGDNSWKRQDQIMRAQRLRNGDVACITDLGVFLRLDASGKELKSFPVNVRTYGGRVDVQPNGNVLIPELASNRVVEFNAEGNKVWQADVREPIAAIRLPNGHTLVTSMEQRRAIELDRAGTVVWDFKSDSRVTRAFRR